MAARSAKGQRTKRGAVRAAGAAEGAVEGSGGARDSEPSDDDSENGFGADDGRRVAIVKGVAALPLSVEVAAVAYFSELPRTD